MTIRPIALCLLCLSGFFVTLAVSTAEADETLRVILVNQKEQRIEVEGEITYSGGGQTRVEHFGPYEINSLSATEILDPFTDGEEPQRLVGQFLIDGDAVAYECDELRADRPEVLIILSRRGKVRADCSKKR